MKLPRVTALAFAGMSLGQAYSAQQPVKFKDPLAQELLPLNLAVRYYRTMQLPAVYESTIHNINKAESRAYERNQKDIFFEERSTAARDIWKMRGNHSELKEAYNKAAFACAERQDGDGSWCDRSLNRFYATAWWTNKEANKVYKRPLHVRLDANTKKPSENQSPMRRDQQRVTPHQVPGPGYPEHLR